MDTNGKPKGPVAAAAEAAVAKLDPQAQWWAEEAERHNELGRSIRAGGDQIDADSDDDADPDAEDAVAHLQQLSPDGAIKTARQWTGRDDITTVEEAVAAVRAALAGDTSGDAAPQ